MGQPGPLFHLFSSFQTHITNITTNRYVKKCPSSIRCWDSNSRPLEHESLPITTRPGPQNGGLEISPHLTKKYFYLHFIFDKIKDHSVQYCDDIHSDTYEP